MESGNGIGIGKWDWGMGPGHGIGAWDWEQRIGSTESGHESRTWERGMVRRPESRA